MITAPLILDTCALIWLYDGALTSETEEVPNEAARLGFAVLVSPISAWEIGLLAAKRRISLTLSPERWFDRATTNFGVALAPMPPRVLIASSFLPNSPLKDPADRVIAATARELGVTIITRRDKLLLAYAAQGHIQALAC